MDATLIELRKDWPGQNVAADIIGVHHAVMQRRIKELGLPRLKSGPRS